MPKKIKTPSIRLKPCPFCGQQRTVVLQARQGIQIRDDVVVQPSFQVFCDPYRASGGCGASARSCSTKEEAVRAWNKRTSYIGKGKDERLSWPDNLVAELLGTDDPQIGIKLSEDQEKGLTYALSTLSDRSRACLLQYYQENKTMQEMSESWNLSRERVRQIVLQALRRLRNPILLKYIRLGYDIASGETEKRVRENYEAEVARVKEQMLAEAKAEVALKLAGSVVPENCHIPLSDMGLSIRPYNCLSRQNLTTAADIFAVEHPERIRNLGKKSGREIAEKLMQLGFHVPKSGWAIFLDPQSSLSCQYIVPDDHYTPLFAMGLSVRPYRCLSRENLTTAADVFAVQHPERIRDLGKKSGKEVAEKLIQLGFDVKNSGWAVFLESQSNAR